MVLFYEILAYTIDYTVVESSGTKLFRSFKYFSSIRSLVYSPIFYIFRTLYLLIVNNVCRERLIDNAAPVAEVMAIQIQASRTQKARPVARAKPGIIKE